MTQALSAIRLRLAAILMAAGAASGMAGAAGAAEDPDVLGTFEAWTAYLYEGAGGKTCYMAGQPIKEEGKYTKRGDVLALITHSPGDKTFDVVSIVAGYTHKADSEVLVKIGSRKFNLFTFEDRAWASEEVTDRELVAAMKRGHRMVVIGTSSRGTRTTDTYSLVGFTKAHDKISAACAVKKTKQ
jgi:invasion protein IalB